MNVYPVNNIGKVDISRYKEGDVFTSDKKIGMIHNGKMEMLVRESDLKEYVKKKDVQKLIDDTLKKGDKK